MTTETRTATELDLYQTIHMLGGRLFWLRHDWDRIPEDKQDVAIQNEQIYQRQLEAFVDQTTQYGVTTPRVANPDGTKGGPTEEYWLWYRWWDAWWEGLDRDEQNRIAAVGRANGDLTSFRPTGDWRQ